MSLSLWTVVKEILGGRGRRREEGNGRKGECVMVGCEGRCECSLARPGNSIDSLSARPADLRTPIFCYELAFKPHLCPRNQPQRIVNPTQRPRVNLNRSNPARVWLGSPSPGLSPEFDAIPLAVRRPFSGVHSQALSQVQVQRPSTTGHRQQVPDTLHYPNSPLSPNLFLFVFV